MKKKVILPLCAWRINTPEFKHDIEINELIKKNIKEGIMFRLLKGGKDKK
jgi:hypothetical protein